MRARDFLFRDLSSDELRALPSEWITVYLGRPIDKASEARRWMRVRVLVLFTLSVYAVLSHRLNDFNAFLLFCLWMYELGFYSERKERCLLDYVAAKDAYEAKVNGLPDDRA